MSAGMERANLRPAEMVSEGARLEQTTLHIPSGDGAKSVDYDSGRALIYRLVAIMLAALLVWFFILVLLLPE